VNATGGRTIVVGNLHDDLVVFATRLDHELVGWCFILTTNRALVTGPEVVLQCITQHQSPLADVELDLVTSVLGSAEVSEGLRGGVGKGDHGLLR